MANADNRASHALYTRSLEDLNVIDNFLFTELSTNEDVNEEFFRIPAVHLSAAGIPFREGDRAEGRAEGLIRLVMRKYEKGKDIEQIADELEEEHAKIEAIVAVIRSCGAEATPEMVYEKAIATR